MDQQAAVRDRGVCGHGAGRVDQRFMRPTPKGYTYPIDSAWQYDRKFCTRETLVELFPFFLSTRRPAFLGSSRTVAGSQTTALAATPFVDA
jgi:hypothetical protein